ncbi:radical SAM protein [Methanopyrus sp. KOL6]|uniref:radical SAM protein n=1 Tax=Methanopyrus sp. KOL6 TaxID=1937004 RepID=UPI001E56059D|nr:radical SAM protein [Methanopyrus sp. KOL6]
MKTSTPAGSAEVDLNNLHPDLEVDRHSGYLRFRLYRLIEFEVEPEEFHRMVASVISKRERRTVPVTLHDTRVAAPVPREVLVGVLTDLISGLAGESGKNAYTGRRVYYITETTGIPLIGHTAFGIIDRGTNVIQVRPLSGCNLCCIYCSVDEGPISRTRWRDFMVDPDYLMEWFDVVAEFKGQGLEAHLDGQGEPTLYPFLPDVVQALKEHPNVVIVSIQTNAVPLSEDLVDELVEAGIDRFNVSVNSLDPKKARAMAGRKDYDVEHVKKVVEYIAQETEADVLVAPLWLPGYNDDDIVEIIKWATKIGAGKRWPPLGIQNYLEYRFGRRPKFLRRIVPMKEFHRWLRELESRTGVRPLVLKPEHFGTEPRKSLPKPFRRGDVIRAEIVLEGRLRGEMIARAADRVIAIPDSAKILNVGDRVRVRVTRDKHNIFVGTLV